MKNLLIFLSVLIVFSCNKQVEHNKQKPPDVELFDHAKDAKIAARGKPTTPKPPKGKGNPHNQPDTVVEPPPDVPVDTTTQMLIFLDHDGETVTGTLWNGGNALTLTPSGMNADQQIRIRDKVARDYSNGFVKTIKVTNSQTEYENYTGKKIHVIITAYHEWYSTEAGGVAYINSYTWQDGTPCFVFSKAYSYNENWIAHACSHEPGHMLGCRHQALWDTNTCVRTLAYRPGWIMGGGGDQYQIPVWGVGLSTCCTCVQDDIAVINSNL